MNEQILKNISKHIELNSSERELFLSFLKFKKLKKKDFVLRQGFASQYQIFVLNGCLKVFNCDENGVEHVVSFAPSDWWCGDLYSFISGKKSTLSIQAILTTEVFLISKKDIEHLYNRIPKFERFFRILFQNAFIIHQNRIMAAISMNADSRYKKFTSTYPDLEKKISQKSIASYIGVTPEFFSEMRRKLRLNSKT